MKKLNMWKRILLMMLILMEMQIKRMKQEHEEQIDGLETCLAKLSEVVAELKDDNPEVPDKDSKQSMQDFVNTIVGYNPFNER